MEKIRLAIDANERGTPRAKKLIRAAYNDIRFEPIGYANLPVDVRFSLKPLDPDILSYSPQSRSPQFRSGHEFERSMDLNVELKGPEDFVSSVLAGRLYNQILAMRELQQPGMVVILGSDEDIRSVIEAEVSKNSGTDEDTERRIALFSNLMMDFEANSYALGIPIFRWRDLPYRRLLAYAHKLLTGGNLLNHLPKSLDGERQVAALCMLVKGIGMKKAKAVLERCESLGNLSTVCCNDDRALRDIPGIGPILAARIKEALWACEKPIEA